MWTMAVPWWEFLVRGAIVYLFLIVLLRLSGKRQVGQLAPFDLVLLLVEQRRSELNERWRQFCNRRFDLGLDTGGTELGDRLRDFQEQAF